MSLSLVAEAPPLRIDEFGAIRVGQTRILLDLVVHGRLSGQTPEQIVERFDTLALSDVYATLAYYLRHSEEIDAYLARREIEAEELRARIEASQRPIPTKAELLARRK